VLRQPSQIVQTTLPRPLGIIFEEDAPRKRAIISGFMDGSPAAQLAQVQAGPTRMSPWPVPTCGLHAPC
jgi:hypothetical protein